MDTGEQIAISAVEDSQSEIIGKLTASMFKMINHIEGEQAGVHRQHHSPVNDWRDCNFPSCYNTIQLLRQVREATPGIFQPVMAFDPPREPAGP